METREKENQETQKRVSQTAFALLLEGKTEGGEVCSDLIRFPIRSHSERSTRRAQFLKKARSFHQKLTPSRRRNWMGESLLYFHRRRFHHHASLVH